jgi:hypothetical protein
MRKRMSEPLSESRLAYLESLGKQEPAPEKPDPIFDKMRRDIASMSEELEAQSEPWVGL